ncbi:MAG: prepilin-type N-terminal cleavage/methylation domain-containing protein [Candidatus Calescibacterium sp.]|nr:prepilin-type N-terminal cleavage/methylation domain-containing protein [Candidatus Calescibacterium sp.]MDW8194770.1 prepilin-type N-terminal cleavage/methylation domain-containing protein [Candidatus Calescibacterium sp.]
MKKNKRGMTLVEVLFATSIFSFVALILFFLFKLGQAYWSRGMAYNLIQNEMKKTSSLLEKYLKQTDVRYVQSFSNLEIPRRSALLFPVQDEEGNIEYLAFIATSDQVLPDRSGFLYFVTFRTRETTPRMDINLTIGGSNINSITRQNINSITLSRNITHTRSIVLLSNNISVFDARVNLSARTVTIKMIFAKRVVGENNLQSVGASMFVTTMNNFN